MITLTPPAIAEAKRLIEKQNQPNLALRVGVKEGGCSGFSYALEFDTTKEGDQTFDYDGIKVITDQKSFMYLDGLTLDFVDNLTGRGFKFDNPNAKRGCGCGSSFSV
ncbi:MAG: iron-sulfur cluster assembly accessory protein [Elusimicrobia bacterium]|nr:iron-sulfur cluster assembly accessory protein [Elusimicrobiota bacterium]